MATDEEYLDNLLKAAMEDEERQQSDAIIGAETIDEDEDWKNSLDEMLASVNTEENVIDSDIDISEDIDFSDGFNENETNYSDIAETELAEMDIDNFDIADLGVDIMDESAYEDTDMSQDSIQDLLNMSDMEGDEIFEEESFDQINLENEEQEAESGKSRKELQEEAKEQKRLAKEAKKEQKRLAKEEKRMAKERKKDEKKAEKEREKEVKKSGAFSSFIDFLTAEEEEETEEALNEAGAEGADDAEAIAEASGKKGKKEKKKKKGKKGKEQGEGVEGEEGGDGEAAPDPKKAAKQAKKELKEQKKRERAEQRANEPRVKVLSRKTFLVLIAFCATIIAAVVFLSVFLTDFVDKSRARLAFNNGNYREAYVLLYGKDLNSGDQVMYHRVNMILRLERKLEVYEYYLNEGELPQALDTLLQGVSQYNEMMQGDNYGASEELRTVYLKILDILNQQYGLSEEEVLGLLAQDDNAYSRIIYELTLGADFGLPGEGSQEPQPPQDVLPEEEDIINMDVIGEGV